MKIVLTAGGGGHFSPLLCVFSEIAKKDDILVIGRKYAFEGDSALSLEYQTAKRLSMHFIGITAGRLQRKFTKYTFSSLMKVPVGFFQAFRILSRFRPDVVIPIKCM